MLTSTYMSTRGTAAELGFADVLLAGPAEDGGLYVPKSWPQLSSALMQCATERSYSDVAAEVLRGFIGDAISSAELRSLTDAAYGTFSDPKVAPLRQLGDDLYLLELFHGPTLAFKDVALQLVSRLIDRELRRRRRRAVILGATSGDTGAAAVAALAGLASVDVFILHPKGRISDVQRRQMTTVTASNIHNIAVEGTFDDAQSLVKAIFADAPFREQRNLSAINSINWARVAAQIVYYVTTAAQFGDRSVRFVVPTGNFGDIFAGYCAVQMGMPAERLVIATNENDILVRTIETGRYEPRGVVPTTSPAMDIQVSSNFERLLFDACGRDGAQVRALMSDLQSSGRFTLSEAALKFIRDHFAAVRASEQEVSAKMAQIHKAHGILVDPHTAVGLVGADKSSGQGPRVVLSTAHPSKFPDAVAAATGVHPDLPPGLQPILTARERYDVLKADKEAVKAYILQRTKV